MKRLSPLALLMLGTAPAAAQDLDLGTIIVFANQTEIAAERTGATVDVVDAEALDGANTRVAETLDREPGISVTSNGGLGGTSTVRVRGLGGAYVPVLIDGIDVTDPSRPQTQYDWAGLTGGGVSRVEVLKGSQSALYGADAVGGVINITTARATEPGTEVTLGAEVGAYGIRRAGITVATMGETGQLSFGISRAVSDGFSASSLGTEPDGHASTRINVAGEVDLNDRVRLGFAAFTEESTSDFDEFFGDGFAPYDEVSNDHSRGARLYLEAETGALTHTLSLSGFANDRVSSSDGTDSPFSGSRRKVDYKGVWQASDRLTLSFGADITRESFEIEETDFSAWPAISVLTTADEVQTTGLFAEAQFAPNDRTDIAVSLRRDDHSAFGASLSGRLAASFRPREDIILRASVANGFRAPSLYELHSQLYGNPALGAETSRSFELGAEKRYGGDSFVRATLFSTTIEDLITYDFVTSRYAEIGGTSQTRGLELAGRAELAEGIAMFGSYTLTETEAAGGGRLPRVPRHDLMIGIDATITDRLSGSLTLSHVADRPADGFPSVAMPDYSVVDLNLTYAVTDTTELYMRIENLTDTDYQTVSGYNTPGRSAFVGFRASF